ncbi:MAG: ParB/RepB/Spo0J family partition protein [Phycisphaeraceae bacterium]|nr:ParB/RepB/Spo0J family partition protein [Phycisphaerales bacterium]MCB9859830.1 ParB/RepB/Spo0J family partition protein [Phycisphaeraceae bacterium]
MAHRRNAKPTRLGKGLRNMIDIPVRVDVPNEIELRSNNIVENKPVDRVSASPFVVPSHTPEPPFVVVVNQPEDESSESSAAASDTAFQQAHESEIHEDGAVVAEAVDDSNTLHAPIANAGKQPTDAIQLDKSYNTTLNDDADRIEMINVEVIAPSPYQPRRKMDEAGLVGLAASIRRSGMMQPVLVRPIANENGGAAYELVAGERRWRAAVRAGLLRVPALVRHLSNEEAAEQSLVENVQREDLPPMDRAWALRRMAEQFGLTQTELADRVGLERSSVANLQRLTELEPELQEHIDAGSLSTGHGKALLSCEPGKRRIELGKQAAEAGWSVRKLEQMVKSSTSQVSTRSPATTPVRPAVHQEIEKKLAEHLGTRVRLRTDKAGKRGTLTMDFYDLDHFEGLMQRLGFDTNKL